MFPADFNTTNNQEGIVNIITPFIMNAKTPILVQPRQTTLSNPSIYLKFTTIKYTSFTFSQLLQHTNIMHVGYRPVQMSGSCQ